MSVLDRSEGRDIHIYDASRPTEVLGGLILNNGVTNHNLFQMIDVLFVFKGSFSLRHGGNTIQDDQSPLQRGEYYIDAAGWGSTFVSLLYLPAAKELTDPFSTNDEPYLTRANSVNTASRTPAFPAAVRSRDPGCPVTGRMALNGYRGSWAGFECAYIFPLAYQNYWENNSFDRWITIPPLTRGLINSVQNGILLDCTTHQLFDQYHFSINPDDGHKFVCFSHDGMGIAGGRLDQGFLDHPHRPVDQLFRWHFRQAVLANMRGAGEPVFEHDFPPGCDMVGHILSGPKAAKRMEFEMFNRLTDFQHVESS